MINILFFAKYREQAGLAETSASAAGIHDVAAVIDYLQRELGARVEFLDDQQLLIAVNQETGDRHSPVADGDEVAFFPPVTGG